MRIGRPKAYELIKKRPLEPTGLDARYWWCRALPLTVTFGSTARLAASRPKGIEKDDQSSKTQFPIVVSLSKTYSAEETCKVAHISRNLMYRLARDADNPFPLHYCRCKIRDGFVIRAELVE